MNRSAFGLLSLVALLWTSSVSLAQNTAADPSFFATKLYPALEAAHCRICHATDGVASGTRLHFPDPGASQEEIQVFGLSRTKKNSSVSGFSIWRRHPMTHSRHVGAWVNPPELPSKVSWFAG
jgi:hypothetical protein